MPIVSRATEDTYAAEAAMFKLPVYDAECSGIGPHCIRCPDLWHCSRGRAMIRTLLIVLLLTAIAFPVAADAIMWQATPTGTLWSVNLGSLAVCMALIAGFWKLIHVLGEFHSDYIRIVSDVDTLMRDYCERKGIDQRDLPRYNAVRSTGGD